jgi:hypothetical protein
VNKLGENNCQKFLNDTLLGIASGEIDEQKYVETLNNSCRPATIHSFSVFFLPFV